MTPVQIQSLRRDLTAIGERPWRFVYCPAGTDGFPVLLLARKRLPVRELAVLMQWARSRTLVRGTIVRSQGRLVLTANAPDVGWFVGLRDFFGPMISELAEARLRG